MWCDSSVVDVVHGVAEDAVLDVGCGLGCFFPVRGRKGGVFEHAERGGEDGTPGALGY